MNCKEDTAITGGLSHPSKMPGFSYSLPASRCKVGAILARKIGTVCHSCYAMRGKYTIPSVQRALEKRFNSLSHPQWIDAMTFLIARAAKRGHRFFRWHDSGDLQSVDHLARIVEVARRTPNVRHWLPTREVAILRAYQALAGPPEIPQNLTIRIAQAYVNAKIGIHDFPSSGVITKDRIDEFRQAKNIYICPAPRQDNNCGKCRACWNQKVQHVMYVKH